MSPCLPPLRLTGAQILRDGELQRRSIALSDGRITRGPLPEVDLTGYLVLPGIVDLHSDALDRHIPRRLAPGLPMQAALAASDRECAAQGVTTCYLAQRWSWEGGRRSPDQAEATLSALEIYRQQALTDLHVKIRAETHKVDGGERLIEAVRRHRVGYVVFTDSLEDCFTMRRTAPGAFARRADSAGLTPEGLLTAMERAQARARDVPRHLCTLADAFDAAGTLYGSHADPDGETRERFSMIGARIAEFPHSLRAAAAAHAMMNPVIMGAGDVAAELAMPGATGTASMIAAGLCDALASQTLRAALPHAAWALADSGVIGFAQAWAMISARPAEIMRLPDRGRLNPGLRADMVVMNAESRQIEATICGGRPAYLAGEAGRRLVAAAQGLQLAAE